MSISSHSPSSSVVGKGNESAKGDNPPLTSVNHSTARLAACNDNLLAKGKKPLHPFPMSSVNHSSATSAVCNGKLSDKGKEPAWESPFNEVNEAGPSVIRGSSLYPDPSNSIRMSPQCSYSDVVPQRCLILNHNYNDDINGAFPKGKPFFSSAHVSSLGLPNGQRPCYNEENGWVNCSRGGNHRQGGYDYRFNQDRPHEMITNYYHGITGMAPHMQQPPVQLCPLPMPLISPPMCHVPLNGDYLPSLRSIFQGPNSLSYVPFDVYRYPTHPQSDFFSSLDDLRARLRKQIDYYFSSENLKTDSYLKNLMDGHGWVPITLIMKFRKVVALLKDKEIKMQSASISDVLQVQDRSLSNDQLFVLDSIRPSDAVEVQGDRMRKRHKWKKWVLIPP